MGGGWEGEIFAPVKGKGEEGKGVGGGEGESRKPELGPLSMCVVNRGRLDFSGVGGAGR